MKFSISFLFLSMLMTANAVVQQDTPEEDPLEFEVELDIKCKSDDALKKVNLHDGIYAGKALVESFQKVHAEADGGDHTLKHLVFGGNMNNQVLGDNLESWWWSYGYFYFGGYSCRFCYEPDDDTLALQSRERENDVHKAWETEFQAMLDAHPKDAFAEAKECRIVVIQDPALMRARPDNAPSVFDEDERSTESNNSADLSVVEEQEDVPVPVIVDADEPEQFAVEIDFSCKGMDIVNDMDLGNYAGWALKESYNSAHKVVDDDHTLMHIHYEGTYNDADTDALVSAKNLRGSTANVGSWWWSYGYFYFGGYSCRFCYEPDDDMLALDRKKKQADVHKIWEEGLKDLLLNHPGNGFAGVQKCHIDVIRDEELMRHAISAQ